MPCAPSLAPESRRSVGFCRSRLHRDRNYKLLAGRHQAPALIVPCPGSTRAGRPGRQGNHCVDISSRRTSTTTGLHNARIPDGPSAFCNCKHDRYIEPLDYLHPSAKRRARSGYVVFDEPMDRISSLDADVSASCNSGSTSAQDLRIPPVLRASKSRHMVVVLHLRASE